MSFAATRRRLSFTAAAGRRAMKLLGVVFAGGKSSRMGQTKALLPWPEPGRGEGSMLLRATCWLRGLCVAVEVAAGDRAAEIAAGLPAEAASSLHMIPDAEAGVGPIGGLVAALERSAALQLDGALVLACDMPLVGEREIEPLVERVERGADIALWQVDGLDQPLCAVYSVRAAHAARLALDRKARRLVAIFDEDKADGRALDVVRLIPDENSRVRLMNVNTPSDYDLVRRRFHECQGRSASSPSGPDRR